VVWEAGGPRAALSLDDSVAKMTLGSRDPGPCFRLSRTRRQRRLAVQIRGLRVYCPSARTPERVVHGSPGFIGEIAAGLVAYGAILDRR